MAYKVEIVSVRGASVDFMVDDGASFDAARVLFKDGYDVMTFVARGGGVVDVRLENVLLMTKEGVA